MSAQPTSAQAVMDAFLESNRLLPYSEKIASLEAAFKFSTGELEDLEKRRDFARSQKLTYSHISRKVNIMKQRLAGIEGAMAQVRSEERGSSLSPVPEDSESAAPSSLNQAAAPPQAGGVSSTPPPVNTDRHPDNEATATSEVVSSASPPSLNQATALPEAGGVGSTPPPVNETSAALPPVSEPTAPPGAVNTAVPPVEEATATPPVNEVTAPSRVVDPASPPVNEVTAPSEVVDPASPPVINAVVPPVPVPANVVEAVIPPTAPTAAPVGVVDAALPPVTETSAPLTPNVVPTTTGVIKPEAQEVVLPPASSFVPPVGQAPLTRVKPEAQEVAVPLPERPVPPVKPEAQEAALPPPASGAPPIATAQQVHIKPKVEAADRLPPKGSNKRKPDADLEVIVISSDSDTPGPVKPTVKRAKRTGPKAGAKGKGKSKMKPEDEGMRLIDDADFQLLREGSEPESVPQILTKAELAEEDNKFALAGENSMHNFITHNLMLSGRIRSKARKVQEYLPESATTSRILAMSMFLLDNGTGQTKCAYHSVLDHQCLVNDQDSRELKGTVRKPKFDKKVTGVPFSPSQTTTALPSSVAKVPGPAKSLVIKRLPSHNDNPHKVPPVVSGMGEAELLTFFRKIGEAYYLHCGCELETCLLDFYLWKSSPMLVSPSTGAMEYFGVSPDPRHRGHFNHIFRALRIRVDDLYLFDRNGVRRDTSNAPEALLNWYSYHGLTLPSPLLPPLSPSNDRSPTEDVDMGDEEMDLGS
ncbi:hypothetical protein D9611_014178 [Ephemerocybe angulata]|uniref:Uncharacterized protein n=1 Tax=Ephemerocybe angulata TaxID=980116 RepID=A0A8H5FEZ8_9AGAR|nr:hypothetical protein D9611_014178 [Tulosesus angulatus]